MELGDLLRSTLPGDPEVIRAAARALDVVIEQAMQVRAGLTESLADADADAIKTDEARAAADALIAQLDAEVDDVRQQQRTALAYADRLEVRQAEMDRLANQLNGQSEALRLLPLPIPDGDAMPWWARPRVSSMLGLGESPASPATTAAAIPSMGLIDAAYLTVTAWRQTDDTWLDDALASNPRRPERGDPSSSSPSPASSSAADVAAVLDAADRAVTLLVGTPDELVLRQAWAHSGAAVLGTDDGASDASRVIAPDTVAAALATLVGLDGRDGLDGLNGELDAAGTRASSAWEITTDRDTVEALLSPDAGVRVRAIDTLRADPALRGAGEGAWRAWSLVALRPTDGVINGVAVIVLDTPVGHFVASPLVDWATLRPASAATVRAVITALVGW